MKANIFEIKCPVQSHKPLEETLKHQKARFIGTDHQKDTYFNVRSGRLKLRQGDLENTLIYYHRPETKSIKNSTVLFQKLDNSTEGLLGILTKLHGISKVVDKVRKIYFIDNVKFHLDYVDGLGSFMEIEAIDESGQVLSEELRQQCDYFIDLFELDRSTFIDQSYSDMVPENKG